LPEYYKYPIIYIVKLEKEIRGTNTAVQTIEDLTMLLDLGGIDYANWGETPGSKSVEKLFQYIQAGEYTLVFDPEYGLVREVEQVGVFTFARDPDGLLFLLKEDRQVFQDGRVRKRDLGGVSYREKLHSGKEGFNAAVWRGLEEELPILYTFCLERDLQRVGSSILRIDPYRKPTILIEDETYIPSFPGLPNRSKEHRYAMLIPTASYRPEGYVTDEEDKTTYFMWEQVASNHPFLPITSWQKLTNIEQLALINNRSTANLIPTEIPIGVIAEYEYLINRSNELSVFSDMEYGSPIELENTATAFRLMDLKEQYPLLRKFKISANT
jgi:hypothetical protein